ncbi:phosphodiester glycosidase family protein [Arcticibacter tournemirensis]|uniref:Phosphodiester glycosidase family protein n=1 Tax=Arcticibacter tournemirensis TaxID=699437 RepID=A0A4Q0M5G7_9SPHI|nr:phosphodiester glycosidase family protein [Arcticibacter tournemirensis]RXF68033.1 phosphodiester glycosidase family protein [Arcticibacter tournemirensis]
MKKIFNFLVIGLFTIVISACSKNDEGEKITIHNYVESVEILNKEAGNVVVDNFIRQISAELIEGQKLSNVQVRVVLAEGATMVSPSAAEATYNLASPAGFTIEVKGRRYSYTIKAKEIDEPVRPYKGWEQCTGFGELPRGIRVYKSPAQLQGKNAVAYIAVANINKGRTFDVVLSGSIVEGRKLSQAKTPAAFYASGSYPVIINGGYFTYQSGYYQLSLACSKNSVLIGAQQDVWPGDGNYYLPARGIFSNIQGAEYSAEWAVTSGTSTYAYQTPVPKPTMPAVFPSFEGARTYTAQTGVGGGPVLLKNGIVVNTYNNEMFKETTDVGATISNPRTAIGCTADGKLILFVCEGRNKTADTPGFTLLETAKILLDLGCVDAINLDGGGSSCMLVNGKETIKPSDGAQREITSAVILR